MYVAKGLSIFCRPFLRRYASKPPKKGVDDIFFEWVGAKRSVPVETAKFILYHGPTKADKAVFGLHDKSLVTHKKFDPCRKTILYLHGFAEKQEDESLTVVVAAYNQRPDYNLLVLDWEDLAAGDYTLDGIPNAKMLGPVLAEKLLALFEYGLDIEGFHLVGHSLGGQLAGIVGREIIRLSEGAKKLKRISALDPAFPLFYMMGLTKHLNKDDAQFVDVIHTDAWFYGAPVSTGTVDFWPNGGRTLQPGCPKRNYKPLTEIDLCSHVRSWILWSESVVNKYPDKFEAVAAKNWSGFKEGFIKANPPNVTVVMGNDCPTNVSGDYYLQTNGAPPYARGKAGTKYTDPKQLVGYEFKQPDPKATSEK